MRKREWEKPESNKTEMAKTQNCDDENRKEV